MEDNYKKEIKSKLIKSRNLLDILQFISTNDPSHQEIADKFHIAKSTAKNNEERLRKIINVKTRTKIVIFYYQNFYIFNDKE